MKINTNGLGHMTKMATTPYMLDTLNKSSSTETVGRLKRNLVLGTWNCGPLLAVQIMTLTYFVPRSSLVT